MKAQRVLAVAVMFLFLAGLGFGQTQGRTEHYSFPVSVVGQDLGSCGDFNVLTDYTVIVRGTVVFDKEGQARKEFLKAKVIGQSIYYNSNDPDLFLIGGPGELEIDHFNFEKETAFLSGLMWKIKVPGYGWIYMETGRLVWDINTGEILSNTAHNQFFDEDLEAVCNALTP